MLICFSLILIIFKPEQLFVLWSTFLLAIPAYSYFEKNKIAIRTILCIIVIILSALINELLLPYLLLTFL